MREIKYRAYDCVLGMSSVTSIDFENKTITVACENETYYTLSFYETDLLQYTGLKDKNGKEIYEGDIVEYSVYEHSNRNELRVQKTISFDINRIHNIGFNISASYADKDRKLKIIGNIYDGSN